MVEYGPIPCIRHVQGVCLMYKCVQALYHHWYSPIPCIRHVQGVCLMYKSE